jgi:hypothetical protein
MCAMPLTAKVLLQATRYLRLGIHIGMGRFAFERASRAKEGTFQATIQTEITDSGRTVPSGNILGDYNSTTHVHARIYPFCSRRDAIARRYYHLSARKSHVIP